MMTLFEKALNKNEILNFAFGRGIYYIVDREYDEHSVYHSWSGEILPLVESRGLNFVRDGVIQMFREIISSDVNTTTGHFLLYHLHVLYYLISENKIPKIELSQIEELIVPKLESYVDSSVDKKESILNSIVKIKQRGGLESFNIVTQSSRESLDISQGNEKIKGVEIIQFSKPFKSDQSYINNFEEKYFFTIPSDYKSFLLKFGGGVPDKNHYYKELDSGEIFDFEISAFYGNSSEETSLDLGFFYAMTLGVIPRGLLPIADDGIGNHICIGHSGDYLNKIYIVWDTEEEQLTDVVKLEDSLSDFISHLR